MDWYGRMAEIRHAGGLNASVDQASSHSSPLDPEQRERGAWRRRPYHPPRLVPFGRVEELRARTDMQLPGPDRREPEGGRP